MTGKVTIPEETIVTEKNYDLGSLTITIGADAVRLFMYILNADGQQVGSETTELKGEAYDKFMAEYPDILKASAQILFTDKGVDVDVSKMSDGAAVVASKINVVEDLGK